MRRAILLANPVAGQRRLTDSALDELLSRLYEQGIDCQAVLTRPGPCSVPSLDLSDKDLLIVRGGDGTLHQALGEVVRWRRPLALLPVGTANVLARELKIPLREKDALDLLARGSTKRIFLGSGNGRHFHVMAGIGIDAYIIERVRPRLKDRLGRFSYWLAGLSSFWQYPMQEFELRLDGEPCSATFAVIAKARTYGGQLLMAPRASPCSEAFHVSIFTSKSHARFIAYLWGALRGRHIGFPDVIYRPAHRVEALGAPSLQVQMDGELAGALPMTFAVIPRSIEILAP